MRSLTEINLDIAKAKQEYETKLSVLNKEVELFRDNCPHPDYYLNTKHHDYEDSGPGVPQYEYSITAVDCAMCGSHWSSKQYNKNAGQSFGTRRPSAREIIDQ